MKVRSKKPGIKESQIEEEILFYLNTLKNSFFWKNQASGFFDGKAMRKHHSRFYLKGTSDILGLFRGAFYAFEVKTPASIRFYELHQERLSITPSWGLKNNKERHFRRQIEFQKMVKTMGGNAFFVSSVLEVKKALQL